MPNYTYQNDFLDLYSKEMLDAGMRGQKANRIISVLSDNFSGSLDRLAVLDIGCSSGIMADIISSKVDKVVGIDIDKKAIEYAKKTYQRKNLCFEVQDSMGLKFTDNSFDVVICAHVYEHVPDCHKLMSEIYRVLKPGGVCYFAAANRLTLIEAHYKLPLLSIIPKSFAHLYLRLLNKGKFYYENHLSLWGLRKLVSRFEITDYTAKIIEDPHKYYATEMVKDRSFKQKIARFVCRGFYWLFPSYIWLLRKKGSIEQ